MTAPCSILFAVWALNSNTWNLLWASLGIITILLIVLLRTRWVREKTWRKCGILSLWVHVLLAFAATTVRIVVGAPETGNDQPIRVAIIYANIETTEEKPQPEVTPAWEQLAAPPLVASPPDAAEEVAADEVPQQQATETTEDPSPAPPIEAPPLAEAPEEAPAESPEPARTEKPSEPVETPQEPVPADNPQQQPEQSSELVSTEIAEQQPPADVPSTSTGDTQKNEHAPPPVTHPNLPANYADRFIENREELANKRGGSSQTEKAVQAALGWLADAQSKDGGWEAAKFGAGEERMVMGHDRQGAGAKANTGITGLALLAFLGAGHTHHHGDYRTEVARGLEYLRQRQRADGALYGEAELFARTYCHSMATFALCEALAMTRDERLRPAAERAVAYSLSTQHPTDGGWRYLRGHTGDTSQLGWIMMALKSAELAEIEIPPVTWTRVERFLRRVQRGNAGGLAAYRPDGPASHTMTAEAWYCHQLLGDSLGTYWKDAAIGEATESLLGELPSQSHPNLYYWYYATLALHHNRKHSSQAEAAWQTWNQALTAQLLSTQLKDGSWSEKTVWGGYGGRVYTTALSAMCLEVYYRYAPTPTMSEIADRDGWHSLQR